MSDMEPVERDGRAASAPAGTATAGAATAGAAEVELTGLYERMAADHLQPLWTITRDLLTTTPRPATLPWRWSGEALRRHAQDAVRLVPVDRGGERRAISLVNPGLGGRPYATSTLWGALQCLGPRESAPAHRHSPGAIRFVLEGDGVWTTVDGDACDMHPGDLVLTPSWTWHDHNNTTDQMMLWFDGLDLPLVEALDAVFFEPHPDFTQPVVGEHNRSEVLHGAGLTVAADQAGAPGPAVPSPLLVYRWEATDQALAALAEERRAPMVTVELANPRQGGSVLPTLACAVHRLRPGPATTPRRRVGSAVFVAFRGSGATTVDGTVLEWRRGDMFAVPSWAEVSHRAEEPSDLFSLSDEPVMRLLGLWREQLGPGLPR